MKKIASLVIFILFAGISLTSFLSAQEPKRGRFTISLFGGELSGVGFLAGYRASPGVAGGSAGGGNLIPEYNAVTDGPRLNSLSAGSFGVSIGYIVGIGPQPINGHFWLSFYVEASYSPTVRFSDGTETRTWSEWDQAQFSFVDKSDSFLQTDRKAGMYGATLGLVVMPLRKIPLGLDLGIGWWRFNQSYTSGAMQFLEGKTDLSGVTGDPNTGLSTSGQGKLERNHSALLFKIGLTYKISSLIALDLAFRTAAYYESHDTDYIYVETGETVKAIGTYRLGNLLSGGITLSF